MGTKYIAKAAFWEVYKTSFEDGDTDNINSFDEELNIECETLEELVEKVADKMLLDKSNMVIDPETSSLGFSVLVDVENTEASKHDVDLWRKGELELYNASILIPVTKIVDESDVPAAEMEKAAQKTGVAIL